MTRKELLIHMLGVILNLAIACERIADNPTDKQRSEALQARLDEWLAIINPPVL